MQNFNSNKRKTKKMSAKEEVIYDNVCGIRKQIIHLQLEIKFAKGYVEDNSENLANEAVDALKVAIQNMETEVGLLLQKLKFYQKERDAMIDKRIMNEYRKFPEKINMSQMVEIQE